MLHREGGELLGICQKSEFIDIHALDLRITKLLNPYFSKLCIIVSLNEVRLSIFHIIQSTVLTFRRCIETI